MIRRFALLLFVGLAGCSIGPPIGNPATWTKAQWNAKADLECAQLLGKPGAACRFDAPYCNCITYEPEPFTLAMGVRTIQFNACAVLHAKGEIP